MSPKPTLHMGHRFFFWLLLVLLPTQLGYHFWPDWAMILGRRVDYLTPTVYFTDVLIFFLVFFWLISERQRIRNYVLGIMEKKHRHPLITLIPNAYSLILLFILVTVNIFLAQNRMVALYKWLKVSEFVLLGWYVVKTKPSLKFIITPLSLGVFYSSILAIGQFILQRSIGGPFWLLGERTFTAVTPGIARIDWCQALSVKCQELLRPYSTFSHPNVLGGYLAVLLPFLANLLIYKSTNLQLKKYRWYYIFAFCLGVLALVLTFSRSAIVLGLIAIAITFTRIRNYELGIMKKKHPIILVLMVFIVLLPASYFMIHNSTDESVAVRVALNEAAFRTWRSSPLVGVGLGNYLVALPRFLPIRTIYFLQPAHNIYLMVLAETGIVGVLMIGWLMVLIIKKYELGIRNNGNRKSVDLFIIHISLFIILFLGLVDHYPLTLQQGQLLTTLLVSLSFSFRAS